MNFISLQLSHDDSLIGHLRTSLPRLGVSCLLGGGELQLDSHNNFLTSDDGFELREDKIVVTFSHFNEGEKRSVIYCVYRDKKTNQVVGKEEFPIVLDIVSLDSSLLLTQVLKTTFLP